MDNKTSYQLNEMKDKLYEAFLRVSDRPFDPAVAAQLGQIAQGYAALAKVDVDDTANYVRARAGGFPPFWNQK